MLQAFTLRVVALAFAPWEALPFRARHPPRRSPERRRTHRLDWFGVCVKALNQVLVGLRAGDDNDGDFLLADDEAYETACSNLLLKHIRALRPRAIWLLVLSSLSVRTASSLAISHFQRKKRLTFSDIDTQGRAVRGAQIVGHDHKRGT